MPVLFLAAELERIFFFLVILNLVTLMVFLESSVFSNIP